MIRTISTTISFALLGTLMIAAPATVSANEWTGTQGFEYRYFKDPGNNDQAQHGMALRLSANYYGSWNDGDDILQFYPYLLLDQHDSERTHADIRELLWTHVFDTWEVRTGITRVFWGKTEFINVVDVINQTDLVDDLDEKLGQPMVNLSFFNNWGILDLYALIGFRERTYPGRDGRLRPFFPFNADDPIYEDGASEDSIDFAFRFQRPLFDSVEMAISGFSGVDREPRFAVDVDVLDLSNATLIPVYRTVDQLGLELEYIWNSLALKMESVWAEDNIESYQRTVGGIEYSLYGIFGSNIDLTMIAEGMYDTRGADTLGFLEHDIAFGARFAFNDERDTSVIAGLLWDPDSDEKVVTLQASRRLAANLKLEFQLRSILEQGFNSLPKSSFEALEILYQQGELDFSLLDFDLDTLLRLLPEIIVVRGNLITINDQYGRDALNEFVKLVDEDRKLSVLESDDHILLKLTYYY